MNEASIKRQIGPFAWSMRGKIPSPAVRLGKLQHQASSSFWMAIGSGVNRARMPHPRPGHPSSDWNARWFAMLAGCLRSI